MDVRQYWDDVNRMAAEMMPKFPEGVVYIVSRANRERNTTAGMICTVSVPHAAECLVNNTHDVATPEQIRAYREKQGEIKQQILQNELSKKQQFVMVVDKQDAAEKGIPVPENTGEPRATGGKGGGKG